MAGQPQGFFNDDGNQSQASFSNKRFLLRSLNLEPPPIASNLALDSSLKKNTAFIKRLKTALHLSDSVQVLVKETRALSLDRYLSEISMATNEGILKCKNANEIWGAIEVISALHQRFSTNFSEPFFQQFLSGLALPTKQHLSSLTQEQREREENARILRQRSLLRCLAEFDLVGLLRYTGKQIAASTDDGETTFVVIRDLLTSNKDALSIPLPLAISFCKQYAPLYLPSLTNVSFEKAPTPSESSDIQNPQDTDDSIIKPATKDKFKKLLTQYFDALGRKAVKDHLTLQQLEGKNQEIAIRSGQIFEDRAQNFEKLSKDQEKLWTGILNLAELLSLSPPTLPEINVSTASNAITGTGPSSNFGIANSELGIWSDEEEKRFYEELIDLKDEVPVMLLGLEADLKKEPEETFGEQEGEESKKDAQAELEEEMEKLAMKDLSLADNILEATFEKSGFDQEESNGVSASSATSFSPTAEALPSGPAARLTALLTRLDNVHNSDTLDRITVEFAYVNSRAARNRLIKYLVGVNKSRMDLIPFLSRMVATLSNYMPDIITGVLSHVEDEFRYLQRKRKIKQELFSARSKNIRWISELTKFNLVSSHLILHFIKVCVDDLTGVNIDNLCNLLEGCGRWVLNNQATRAKMILLLEQMKKKKISQNLDSRQLMMLENAYYQCDPPDRPIIEPKIRTPMEQFLRYLLCDCLSKKSVDKIIKTLRKLNWNDPEVVQLLKKILTKVWKIKFGSIYLCAIIVYDLSKFHPAFSVSIVDQVLENIRFGMELNLFKHNQQRVATIKYLGELYNYRVVESRVIFDTLWSFVTFGHLEGRPWPDVISPTDTPDDFFRIRLICTLLNTCGHCFDRSSSKRRLDNFLKFFIMYLRCKNTPPMDIDFLLQDTFEELRPKLNIYISYEEASKAVDEMLSQTHDSGIPDGKGDQEDLQEHVENGVQDDNKSQLRHDNDRESESDDGTIVGGQQGQTDLNTDEQDLPRNVASNLAAEEEEEFEKELAKMVAETGGQPTAVTPIEPGALGARKAERNALVGNLFSDRGLPILKSVIQPSSLPDPINGPDNDMTFTLLTKKGNKQQLKTMQIPSNASIAVHTRNQQMNIHVEHEQLKKLVLEYEEREEANERKNMEAEMARKGINLRFVDS
ncbi:hypothetical protein O181_008932 [Austropuccinia psidii MF-1]|uniref:MIF4G domain-containing protein n=1 Tax=Austropuccinia psidii MF-1 TaxID=1389203 RepID=A0A9Q3BQQ1_9BASI|nr:hypothetical protein [Austropuccinia psidii MF-1]